MVTVHHLNNSRSQRVLWLLEELGVPYEIKKYSRDPKTMLAPPELRQVHPLGKAPIVTDEGHVLVESGAVLEHLVERYGNGRMRPPPGSLDVLRYRQYLHYAEGSLMPLLLLSLVTSRIRDSRAPFFVRPIARQIASQIRLSFLQPQFDTHLAYLDSELATRPWFAGQDLTAADVQMSFPLEAADARVDLASYPRLVAFLERIRARPAYQRAIQKGGAFVLA